jgi:hypothetical protein
MMVVWTNTKPDLGFLTLVHAMYVDVSHETRETVFHDQQEVASASSLHQRTSYFLSVHTLRQRMVVIQSRS